MAHNTTITTASGTDVINDYDLTAGGAYPTTGKVPAGVVFVSANTTTAPTPVTAANGFYVQPGTATTWNVGGTVAVSGSVAVTGTFWQATQPVSLAALPALATGSNVVGGVTQSGTWTVQPGNTANSTPWLTTDTPATSGGLAMSATISAASTNATSVKASAGQVYGIEVFNTNAAARFLKLYNKASAPTVGTDTPVKVLTIPGNAAGAGMVISFDKGLAFGTGIAFALTTGVANSDTGAVAANELVVNIDYK